MEGEFLCVAHRVQKVHPMANVLGTVKKISKIANTNMDKAVRNKKEQKDFEIEEFIKVAQKRLDYEEEMLKEMEDEMQVEMREEFDDDFYTE